jgi:hypothetical protein
MAISVFVKYVYCCKVHLSTLEVLIYHVSLAKLYRKKVNVLV